MVYYQVLSFVKEELAFPHAKVEVASCLTLLCYTAPPATMVEVAHPSLPRRWIWPPSFSNHNIVYYVVFYYVSHGLRWPSHSFQEGGFGKSIPLYCFCVIIWYAMLSATNVEQAHPSPQESGFPHPPHLTRKYYSIYHDGSFFATVDVASPSLPRMWRRHPQSTVLYDVMLLCTILCNALPLL